MVHLFDWDELNFAESSREMLVSGNYFQVQINFEPFQEKPPLFFWFQSLSMKIFGINEFAARLPNALFGIITLITIFSIGKTIKDIRFGWIWVLIYLGSFLPHLYYKSGIIDPVFNLFIFLGIYYMIRLIEEIDPKKRIHFCIFSGLFIGLAIITKGPVGLLLLLLTFVIYWAFSRFRKLVSIKEILFFTLSCIIITFFWYGYETFKNGPWFLLEFINYQIELFTQPVAGHQQPLYYHFVVVLLGCFPMSIIALPILFSNAKEKHMDFEKWMKILFWVVMILFTMVSTKIVHYSSMSYLPLSFLAALEIYKRGTSERSLKWVLGVLLFVGFIFSFVLIAVPLIAINKTHWLMPYIDDKFALASLSSDVQWGGYEYYIGIFYAITIVVFIYNLYYKKIYNSLISIIIGTGISLLLLSKYVVPKIEQYSQGPAIEFYKSVQSENKYLTTVGFKSYAHYFYGRIDMLDSTSALYQEKKRILSEILNVQSYNELTGEQINIFNNHVIEWLKNGKTDRTVYFVSRIDRNHGLDKNENLKYLYKNGGFVFYKRESYK